MMTCFFLWKPSEGSRKRQASRRAGRTYHVADLIRICVTGTDVDGELSLVCLRLGREATLCTATVSWKAPNHKTGHARIQLGDGDTCAGKCNCENKYVRGRLVKTYCNVVWALTSGVEYLTTCRAQYYSWDYLNFRREPSIGEG